MSSTIVACPSGSRKVGNSCVLCEAGKYSTNANLAANKPSSCESCATGKVSNPGATACTSCLKGTYQNGNQCSGCPAGRYTSANEQTSCQPCSAGRFGLGSSTTSSCSGACAVSNRKDSQHINRFSFLTSTFLQQAGRYGNQGASNSQCTGKCSRGHFSEAGWDSCKACAAGEKDRDDRKGCDACGAGTWSASGSSTCTNCPMGRCKCI